MKRLIKKGNFLCCIDYFWIFFLLNEKYLVSTNSVFFSGKNWWWCTWKNKFQNILDLTKKCFWINATLWPVSVVVGAMSFEEVAAANKLDSLALFFFSIFSKGLSRLNPRLPKATGGATLVSNPPVLSRWSAELALLFNCFLLLDRELWFPV